MTQSDFDLDRFVEDCLLAGDDATHVREIVARVVSDPEAVLRVFGLPRRSLMTPLHHSAKMTILHLVWAPMMSVLPHDHRMWAVIGVYAGREENTLWRRIRGSALERAGTATLHAGQVQQLARDAIHSVINPLAQCTAAIHVYGGDFFAAERSEWDAPGLGERRFDIERTMQQFAGEAPSRGG
jgi:predicted metal-dependent enzyme (double-stranded beta helix superfamily)